MTKLNHNMQNSSIVCVIFDHSLHFSTIAYINLDYSLQFSYGVYSSQPSHANLDTLLSSLACHTHLQGKKIIIFEYIGDDRRVHHVQFSWLHMIPKLCFYLSSIISKGQKVRCMSPTAIPVIASLR